MDIANKYHKMSYATAGLIEPIKEAAKVNIGAAGSSEDAPKGLGTPVDSDSNINKAQRCTINARAPVFHNVVQTSKMSKLATSYAKGTQQNVIHVTQQIDGYYPDTMDQLEFVGISTDEIDGASVISKQARGHASTAVRVSGTISALHASSAKIPIMSPVCWQTPTKKANIRGVKSVHMPSLVPADLDPITRMRTRLDKGIAKKHSRPLKEFKDLVLAMRKYTNSTTSTHYDALHAAFDKDLDNSGMHTAALSKHEADDGEYKAFIVQLMKFSHAMVSDVNRRNVGTSLGTKDSQINLLLGK